MLNVHLISLLCKWFMNANRLLHHLLVFYLLKIYPLLDLFDIFSHFKLFEADRAFKKGVASRDEGLISLLVELRLGGIDVEQ